MSASDRSAVLEVDADGGAASSPPLAVVTEGGPSLELPLTILPDADQPAPVQPAPLQAALDPEIAALCVPVSAADPCGPDLDLDGDESYQNLFASVEAILPDSFFKSDPGNPQEDGRAFDPSSIDLPGRLEAIKPLLKRTADIRLLVMQARLHVLNRDLGRFAATLAAIAEWLENFWDSVHPRAEGGELGARSAALSRLDLPTVRFPLQYARLFEARRLGAVTYRAWMIAAGEVKPRPGELKHSQSTLLDAMGVADPAALAKSRQQVALLKASVGRIRGAYMVQGSSAGLESLSTLVEQISNFIDPRQGADQNAAEAEPAEGAATETLPNDASRKAPAGVPTSLTEAGEALLAVVEYYNCCEPSSPTLPLVRQAHHLIGKSFIEVISILVPAQLEKAAFQIGADQVFELPVSRLSKLIEASPVGAKPAAAAAQLANSGLPKSAAQSRFRVGSRSEAMTMLEQVQKFFRRAEPASPVPMLCERARSMAERDFMAVLRDVLPKAALKNAGTDR